MKDERLVKTLTLHVSVVEGDRPPGRPARRWSDDIKDWRGFTLSEDVELYAIIRQKEIAKDRWPQRSTGCDF